ncbi:MAG TPA: hypothetical protein VFL84_11395, partial [Gammaproteobacteria bacterium]|nr:hypothetical protein [Gammaproteobacteria bacterium]
MPAASRRSIIAFWLSLGFAPQASAQDLCLIPEPPPELPQSTVPATAPSDDDTLEIVTEHIETVSDSEATLGDSQIKYGEGTITAQGLTLAENGDFDLTGRVQVTAPDVVVF